MTTATQSATTNSAAYDTDEVTAQLFATLHRGGEKEFVQYFTAEGKRRSNWRNVNGKPFVVGKGLRTGLNVYFGINPTTASVTDADRKRFTKDGKTPKDSYIEQYVGSKNDTIAALNCVYAEFDGKDETFPTDEEINAHVPTVTVKKQSAVNSGELVKMPNDKVICTEAEGIAKQAKYMTDPQHYNALAFRRLESAPLKASVAWCSGGGYQAVWLFDQSLVIDGQEARDLAQWLQGAWVGVVGGDPGVNDIRRILRLPGTQNIKKHWAPNFPTVDYVWADFSIVYTVEQFTALLPKRPVKPDPKQRTGSTAAANGSAGSFEGDSVIDAFNEAHKVTDILDDNGYTGTGDERSRPGAPDSNGVNISEDGKYSWHWSSNDPLHETNTAGNPRKVTPFTAFLKLEHDGNMKEAVKAAARMLRMGYSNIDSNSDNGNPFGVMPIKATWRNGSHDEPVVITGIMGEEDGVTYYSIEGSSTGVPADQVVDMATGEIIDPNIVAPHDTGITDDIQQFLDDHEELPPMSLDTIKAAVSAKMEALKVAVNDEQRDAIKRDAITLIAQCDDAFVLDAWAATMPGKLGMSKSGYRSALRNERAAIDEAQAEDRAKRDAAHQSMIAEKLEQLKRNSAPHPYVFHEEMMQIYSASVDEESGEEVEKYSPIGTFTAQIVGETRDEFDNITYQIKGVAIRGGDFTAEIDTDTFGSPSKLKTVMEAAIGPLDTVFSKMETHLGPALKLLSVGVTMQRTKRYERTGWVNGKFLIPGRLPEGVTIDLPKVLPYFLPEITDATGAIEALTLLMQAMPSTFAPIMLASHLGPPAATLAGLSNHRYATMNKGQTGTYKTGTGQAFMALWGEGFLDSKNLTKWGTGATGNAVMHLSTSAHGLPMLIDNYKSNTDRGERGFVETIHVIMEGGEKLRMVGKVNHLREVRDIQAWPVCTGEDMPNGDPATLARFAVIQSRKNETGVPDGIKSKSAHRLPQIGTMWLDFLESDEQQHIIEAINSKFDQEQGNWRAYLLSCNQGMPNVDRVASTLALNEACFYAATLHPLFGHVLKPYLSSHKDGLRCIAEQMSGATTDGLEAYRFVSAIREMLSTGRAIFVKSQAHQDNMVNADKEKIIGWDDGDGGAFLYPSLARMMVEKIMNVKLGDMSDASIGNQLKELGWLGSFDKERSLKTKKINGTPIKMLHISKRGLMLNQTDEQPAEPPNADDDEIL